MANQAAPSVATAPTILTSLRMPITSFNQRVVPGASVRRASLQRSARWIIPDSGTNWSPIQARYVL